MTIKKQSSHTERPASQSSALARCSLYTAANLNMCDNERMAKPVEALTRLFDPVSYLPNGIREIEDHQTALPRIAKDPSLIAAIEEKLEQIPTRHDLHLVDARKVDFLEPESVHLVVTSPPYWTLKEYNPNEGQLGAISDYDQFLDELDKVWMSCLCGRRCLSLAAQKQG